MPASFSDYLFQPVGNTLSVFPSVYVQLTSNATATTYVSTAATDSRGKFTFTNLPPDVYTVSTGPTAAGPWTSTGDTNYVVSDPSSSTNIFNVLDYGAKADAVTVTDGVMDGSTGVLTSASGDFSASDVGKRIIVTRAGTSLSNPTVAISGADGGAGATTLPTGTYTFAYTWGAFDGETTVGTSTATYSQTTGNHIITLTIPATAAGALCTRIYCTVAPGGAFAGEIITTTGTTYAYTTGLTATGTAPSASNTTGAPISTTISSFQLTTQVTLATSSLTACTGATVIWGSDDSAAIIATYDAAVAAGAGTVKMPPGGSFLTAGLTVNNPSINIEADGTYSTALYYTGSGDALRLQMSPFSNFIWPGRLKGFTIDGRGAAAGACGFHLGDCVNLELNDLRAAYFRGTGSKGFWMDNRTNWTERTSWYKVNAYHNTTNILFDVNGGTTSFDHTMMVEATLDVEATGMALQNGATVGYGNLNITGNILGGSTVIDIRDTSALGFQNLPLLMSITAETSGVATGLKVASGAYLYGVGAIDFGAGPFTNTDANAGLGNIVFSGRFNCPGIHTMAATDGHVSMGSTYTRMPSQARTLQESPDTALTGTSYKTNGVTWYHDHRGATSSPNNAWEWSIGGSALLGLTTAGHLYSKLSSVATTNTLGLHVASLVAAGNDLRGTLTITADATGITAPLKIGTVVFTGATYPSAPIVVVTNATTGAVDATHSLSVFGVAAVGTGSFDLYLISGNINASAVVVVDYIVLGMP